MQDDKTISEGYNSLAKLIKKGFITIVLSTNLDNLLEKALMNAEYYQQENFVTIVNRKDMPEVIKDQLNSSRISSKIIKLHGTLESPKSYAFTRKAIFDIEDKIKPELSRVINKNLVIVGYSGKDRDVDVLFESEGEEIYFVNPTLPDDESRIYQTLLVRGKGKIIDGNEGEFDKFFNVLLEYVEKGDKEIEQQKEYEIRKKMYYQCKSMRRW